MIKVFATGNIGKDAEVKYISETNVVNFSIASNKTTKKGTITTWLNCQKWNAEKLTPYLLKGVKVALSGELEIREYEGKYYTIMIVYELEFLSSKETDQQKPEQQAEEYTDHSGLPETDLGRKDGSTNDLPF